MRTVDSSTTSTDLIQVKLPRIGDFWSGLSTRSKENLTLSALNGSPLWNLTPFRRRSSHVSGLTLFTDSARCGAGFQVFVSRVRSVSKTCWLMMIPMRAVCMCGSCVGVSEAIATVTRPRGAAAAGGAGGGAAGGNHARLGEAVEGERPAEDRQRHGLGVRLLLEQAQEPTELRPRRRGVARGLALQRDAGRDARRPAQIGR